MADLDLTEAVEAAARALHAESTMQRRDWDRLPSRMVLAYRHTAAPIVEAAAPVISAQARREALTELAERLRGAERDLLNHDPGQRDKRLAEGTRLALRIKADGIRLALGYIEEALR